MKIRESGMPEPELWETFFDPSKILNALELSPNLSTVIEFGCGYGTFTIPTAKLIDGKVTSLEIDNKMIAYTRQRAENLQLQNIRVLAADFEQDEAYLPDGCADYVMLFNILHGENPENLLENAFRLLSPGAKAGVIHWNFDPETPRGPPMDIRPTPDSLRQISENTGFNVSEKIELPPYHYGFICKKPLPETLI